MLAWQSKSFAQIYEYRSETQFSGGLDAALGQVAATKCEFGHLNLVIELDSARLAPFEVACLNGLEV